MSPLSGHFQGLPERDNRAGPWRRSAALKAHHCPLRDAGKVRRALCAHPQCLALADTFPAAEGHQPRPDALTSTVWAFRFRAQASSLEPSAIGRSFP